MFNFAENNQDTFIGKEYANIKKNLFKILQNKRHWGDVIEDISDINWEVDEATCIRLLSSKEMFYNQIKDHLYKKYKIEEEVLTDIINYQKARLHDPNTTYPISKKFIYNINDVIEENHTLKRKNNIKIFEGKNYNKNLFSWAKEILWFGRRLARYKTKVKENNEIILKNFEIRESQANYRNGI